MKEIDDREYQQQDTLQAAWDTLSKHPVAELAPSQQDQTTLHTNLVDLLKEQETFQSTPTVLCLKPSGNCSAHALMFGIMIAASVAIKNPTTAIWNPYKTLKTLLDSAHGLKMRYERNWSKLEKQSGAFLIWGNTIIHLIEAIQHNSISTTELACLASKSNGAEKSLGRALTDLSHFILYHAVTVSFDTGFSLIEERKRMIHLYGEDNNALRRRSDLLNDRMYYTNPDRILICNYLNVASQLLSIESNLNVNLYREGLENRPIAFTLVRVNEHIDLMLDLGTQTQINTELNRTPHISYVSPEVRFKSNPIVFQHENQTQENELTPHRTEIRYIPTPSIQYPKKETPRPVQLTLPLEPGFEIKSKYLLAQLNSLVESLKESTQNVCQELFVSFENGLVSLMNKYPHYKEQIVWNAKDFTENAIKNETPCYQNNPFFLSHLLQVDNYLGLLLNRLENPIPEQEAAYLFELKSDYLTSGKMHKFQFLEQLEEKIKEHPEKSYKACFLEVRDRTPANRALFSTTRGFTHRFFTRHRLHILIEQLMEFDLHPEERWFDEEAPEACCGMY